MEKHMKYNVNNRKIWFKENIVDVNNAKVNVLTPSTQFGLNVFEGIPCYWNDETEQLYAFRLRNHHERLLNSAKMLQIKCKYNEEFLYEAFIDTIKANEYKENIIVRQTLFVDGFESWSSVEPVEMFISPMPKTYTSSEYNKLGLNVCITSWRRISEDDLSPRIKCGANYINSRAGQLEALKNNYDTCIFLNQFGKVSEGPGSCLFLVKKDTLITPNISDSVLESITRDTIIKIANEMGINVQERTVDRTELYTCDEAFLCGSSMEITPIINVDGFTTGSGDEGRVTKLIHNMYINIVMGNYEKYFNWLTPIY